LRILIFEFKRNWGEHNVEIKVILNCIWVEDDFDLRKKMIKNVRISWLVNGFYYFFFKLGIKDLIICVMMEMLRINKINDF
jgi:hypothetical protein